MTTRILTSAAPRRLPADEARDSVGRTCPRETIEDRVRGRGSVRRRHLRGGELIDRLRCRYRPGAGELARRAPRIPGKGLDHGQRCGVAQHAAGREPGSRDARDREAAACSIDLARPDGPPEVRRRAEARSRHVMGRKWELRRLPRLRCGSVKRSTPVTGCTPGVAGEGERGTLRLR
jgi:hypothetical protein